MIRCSESITLDDFRDGLLIDGKPDGQKSEVQGHGVGFESAKVGIEYFSVSSKIQFSSIFKRDVFCLQCSYLILYFVEKCLSSKKRAWS